MRLLRRRARRYTDAAAEAHALMREGRDATAAVARAMKLAPTDNDRMYWEGVALALASGRTTFKTKGA